ncbi:hypothetical protein FVE85_9713 [Porphyridium purpureum]|uniref:Uncharacterized protein n=1 Tax=Porphyridium purpureum TaxID=35688 RepID=A0A5J4YJR8_PORPP|nr:hypothetical protein FVE85_9713 [Porphyridium purpureum]|eukprot:POR0113..scf246_12
MEWTIHVNKRESVSLEHVVRSLDAFAAVADGESEESRSGTARHYQMNLHLLREELHAEMAEGAGEEAPVKHKKKKEPMKIQHGAPTGTGVSKKSAKKDKLKLKKAAKHGADGLV